MIKYLQRPRNRRCASVIFVHIILISVFLIFLLMQCSYPDVTNRYTANSVIYGKASYYGPKFHGRQTANGEIFDQNALTAAHRSLPFGTICKVTNRSNNKSVTIRINDRGPFIRGRVLDLSYKAMKMLDGVKTGVINARIEILKMGSIKK